MTDYVKEEIQGLYFKTDEDITAIVDKYKIEIPVQGKGRNSNIN